MDTIFFSSIDWDYTRQRPQQIASRLARDGNVLYVNPLGLRAVGLRDAARIASRATVHFSRRAIARDFGVSLYSPFFYLPFPHSPFAIRINGRLLLRFIKQWMAEFRIDKPLVWVGTPSPAVLSILERIEYRLLVYDCLDEFHLFHPTQTWVAGTEMEIVRRADLVLATSTALLERMQRTNPNSFQVPNAADFEYFAQAANPTLDPPPEIRSIPKPIVGYYGEMAAWFNLDVIYELARRHPEWSIVLIGPLSSGRLHPAFKLPNVHFLGRKAYTALIPYLAQFDVCVLPFRINALTNSVSPIKLFEYLAAGKPVVSTPIREVEKYRSVVEIADVGAFAEAVERALANGPDPVLVARRQSIAQANTWDMRVEYIRGLPDRLDVEKRILPVAQPDQVQADTRVSLAPIQSPKEAEGMPRIAYEKTRQGNGRSPVGSSDERLTRRAKIRIAIDVTSMPRQKVGAGYYMHNLVQGIANISSPNDYLVFAPKQAFNSRGGAPPNIPITELPTDSRIARLAWEQVVLPALLARDRVSLLHSTHYTIPIFGSHRRVVTFHDMTFLLYPELHTSYKRFFFNLMIRFAAHRADAIVADSQSTRRDILRLLQLDPAKVFAVPLGVSEQFHPIIDHKPIQAIRRKYHLPETFVLYVGVLEPRKNTARLVRAFKLLIDRGLPQRLVFVGRKGWMYNDVFSTIERLGIADRVIFTGYVPEEDLPPLYNAADLFAYPSLYEGFGLPVLEALACGLPVVTSNISSMPEIVGPAGLLVDPHCVEELAEAMYRVLTDRELHDELRGKGTERSKLFPWERTVKETLSVYDKVLNALV